METDYLTGNGASQRAASCFVRAPHRAPSYLLRELHQQTYGPLASQNRKPMQPSKLGRIQSDEPLYLHIYFPFFRTAGIRHEPVVSGVKG
jgi:hypothetical protein